MLKALLPGCLMPSAPELLHSPWSWALHDPRPALPQLEASRVPCPSGVLAPPLQRRKVPGDPGGCLSWRGPAERRADLSSASFSRLAQPPWPVPLPSWWGPVRERCQEENWDVQGQVPEASRGWTGDMASGDASRGGRRPLNGLRTFLEGEDKP